ncbi:MAG: glycosyltransferase [Blastocatellia bacterium]|nr:glycosyltransferase [Blastocatellia bacterium]
MTPGYLSHTPRVVKEADALAAAGFRVHVVGTEGNQEWAREYTRNVVKGKRWTYSAVKWSESVKGESWLFHKSRLRHRLMQGLPQTLQSWGNLPEVAEGRIFPELARLASNNQADLFIGHYPVGLAAAAQAAKRWEAKLGYDVEDLHTEEQTMDPEGLRQKNRIELLERRYLSRCTHVSAVSEPIAAVMVQKYGITPPVVIHNVFPWSEQATLDGLVKDRKGEKVSLYWYSQTIGPGRGLEEVLLAANAVREEIQFHLRGAISETDREFFLKLAREHGLGHSLYFHPQVPPAELHSRASEHDIGLALEQTFPLARGMTVSNKLFSYLLAGLAVVATDVPGQRHVLETTPEVGFLYPPGEHQKLAEVLVKLVRNPGLLAITKHAAQQAANRRWNWEIEQQKLVQAVFQLF